MSNPFELRLQLFQEARDYLVACYDRDVQEWDRKQAEKYDVERKYDAVYRRHCDKREE